jgi:hypothetical protein
MKRYHDRVIQKKERKPALIKKPNAFDRAAKLLQLNFNNNELNTFINQAPTRLSEGMSAFD